MGTRGCRSGRGRHDHLVALTKAGTLDLIDASRDAVGKLERLQSVGSPQLQAFLALVALTTTIR